MRYSKKFVIIPLLIVSVVAISAFASIYAQKATPGLQVHPDNFDLTIQPGVPTTQTVYLENRTNQAIPVKVGLRNFTALGEEGAPSFTTEDTTYALAKWITVSPANASIEPQSSQKFTFTINPPFNAEPGGHYGAIVFATVPSSLNKTGAALSQEVVSLVLARVPGNVTESASVVSFVPHQSFYEFGPVTIDMRVKNDSQVHITPQGQALIKGTFGDTYTVDLQPYNVLPGAVRKIPIVLPNKLLVGKYTVQLVAAYGSSNKQLTGSTQFMAFPVRYGLVVLVILFILFLMRKRIGKAFKALATGK